MNTNTLTPPPPPQIRGSSGNRLLATLMAMAAPVWAQTTGMLTPFAGLGFQPFSTSVTMNANREWLVEYEFDMAREIHAMGQCKAQLGNDEASCERQLSPPFIVLYGTSDSHRNCRGKTQSALPGVRGSIPFDAWQQTVRARPDQSYCVNVYASEPGGHFYGEPISVLGFRTPADPNPPSTPWAPTPGSSGCFAETSPSLVQSCLNCKYVQTDRRWDASNNQCVSARS